MSKFLERILPRHLHWLLKGSKPAGKRAFEADLSLEELDVFPADPSARQCWFSLTAREREVAALCCMGYKNFEIAAKLGVGYGTVQSHWQNIFDKFGLRKRNQIRMALESWPAEDWWNHHHR
jgi:DNA-binding CsgD family transcriptional regulator